MSRSRLAQHSGYLERLISMIQPRFYVSTDAADSATARRFQKHIAKPRAEEKHQHKITARERKRARLDPAQPTSLDKQREISASEATTRGDLVDGSEDEGGTGDAHIGGVGDDAKGGVLSGIAASAAPSPSCPSASRSGCQLRANRGGEARPRVGAHELRAGGAQGAKHPSPLTPRAGRRNRRARGTDGGGAHRRHERRLRCQPDGFQPVDGRRWALQGMEAKAEAGPAQLLAQAEEKARARRVRTAEGGEDAQIGVWERALEKASGIKQKDDPALLRRRCGRRAPAEEERTGLEGPRKDRRRREAKSRTRAKQSRRAQDEKQVEARPCPAGLRRKPASSTDLSVRTRRRACE